MLNNRPSSLKEYIGQEQIKQNLKVYISSAKKQGKTLDHIVMSGPIVRTT